MITKTRFGLIRPRRFRCKPDPEDAAVATFFIGPLERGYGHTLGAPMRAALLRSFAGVAVTEARFTEATKLLSSSGTLEDRIRAILLNLKELKLDTEEEELELSLEAFDSGAVLAKDFRSGKPFRALQPDLELVQLSKGERVGLKIRARKGRGYRSPDSTTVEGGWIPLESLFSSVLDAQYEVHQARIGSQTDYDELVLRIRTDGSISPQDAMMSAARIIRDQLEVFSGPDAHVEENFEVTAPVERPMAANPHLNGRIEEFELSVRNLNCLRALKVEYVWQLAQKTEKEILSVRNMGVKSLGELAGLLAGLGLRFGMSAGEPIPALAETPEESEGEPPGWTRRKPRPAFTGFSSSFQDDD